MTLVFRCLSLYLSLLATCRAVDAACGTPGRPFGGYVLQRNETTFEGEEIVNYSCNETDYLLGSVNRTCGPDGKWNGSVPICLSPSLVKGALRNLDLTTKNKSEEVAAQRKLFLDQNSETCGGPFKHGGLRITIELKLNRRLEGVRVVFPMTINHTFTVYSVHSDDKRKRCVTSGSGELSQSTGYQVTFRCPSKQFVAKHVYLYFGKTLDQLSICEIYVFVQTDDKKCDTPDTPLNGILYRPSDLSDEYFSFNCDPGFELSGSSSTTCGDNRSWTEETPTCINKTEKFDGKEKRRQLLFASIFGGLGLLLLVIMVIILIVRGFKRRKALISRSGQDDELNLTNTSNPRVPSHIHVPFPLPRDAHLIQGIQLRYLEGEIHTDTTNHYSVPVIPGEENSYLNIIGDPPTNDNGAGTTEPLYENYLPDFQGNCLGIPHPLPLIPQPPLTRFSQLASLQITQITEE